MSENIIFQWLQWQFFEVPAKLLKAWRNFLVFNFDYFSVSTLLKTFFSPWRKYQYSYGRGFDIKRYFEALTFNLISRFFGAVFRTFFIILGTILEVFIFSIGLVIFLGWLLLPLILIIGLWWGVRSIL